MLLKQTRLGGFVFLCQEIYVYFRLRDVMLKLNMLVFVK